MNRRVIVHECPKDGAALTGCCRRSPFELPKSDRLTVIAARVTCSGSIEPAPAGEEALSGGAE